MTHPYAAFLPELLKPARYVGCEHGVLRKDPDVVRTRFCLAFPDTYELGMSHLGMKVLYEILGQTPDLACERAFAPWADLEAELRQRHLPLVSLESATPLHDFHVVGFSLQYELTYTTVLAMLELGGIPLRAADREDGDPLVIGGGPVASHPEPVAPFFDLLLLGEGEHALVTLLRADADLRDRGASRADRVAELSKLPGMYAPALHETHFDSAAQRMVVGAGDAACPVTRRVWEAVLDDLPDSGGGPIPSNEAVFDRAAIEISRGCNQGCRFCQAGFLYRPMRERSTRVVLDALLDRARAGGYDEVSLTALSTADYSALRPLLRGAANTLQPRNVSLSVSSLRAVGLDGPLLDDLRTGRAGSLTFAPEAGSQRMRDRINKRISEPGLLQTAREVAARGWTHIKLYFMFGLPDETDEDVDAIIELAEQVRWAAKGAAHKRAPRVTCAVNNFVPKPHTPMQWCAMEPAEVLRAKQQRLKHNERGRRIGLRLHDVKMSLLEGRLARGDRRLADVIEHAYHHGARYDGWEDQFQPRLWADAFAARELDPAMYLAPLPVGGRLPWDHFDVGLEPSFLQREHRHVEKGRIGPACGVEEGPPGEELSCLRCGLPCPDAAPPRAADTPDPEESALPKAPPPPPAEPVRLRMFFAKDGPAVWLGHLDLVRHVPRILRRAGLRPTYSKGYNPRPKLQFTPPLAVGSPGLHELCEAWVDVDPGARPDEGALLEALRDAALPGLTFLTAQWQDPGDKALSKILHGAEYSVPLPEDADLSLLAERVDEVQARQTWPVERKSRRRKELREVDLRPSLHDVALVTEPAPQLRFSLIQGAGAALKPREVLAAILPGDAPVISRAHHFALRDGVKIPLLPS